MAKILIIDDEPLTACVAGAHHRTGRIRRGAGFGLYHGPPAAQPIRTRRRAVRRQTSRRQRRGTGRQDQGDRTRRRSHPAHRLRQHTRRRAGDQERRIRLHHQRRRQQQDPAAAEPCDGEGTDAAPTGAFRGETLRRTFVRPHHRFVGGAPTGREPRAQSRCDGHVGTAHRRDRNGQRRSSRRRSTKPGRAPERHSWR